MDIVYLDDFSQFEITCIILPEWIMKYEEGLRVLCEENFLSIREKRN